MRKVSVVLVLIATAAAAGCLPTPVAVECPAECAPAQRRCDPERPGVLQECRLAPGAGACPGFEDVEDCAQDPSRACAEAGEGGARCQAIACAPGRCAPGRGPVCLEDGALGLCDTSALDADGCGVVTTRRCGDARECRGGECVEQECPALGVVCVEGDRACSPEGELLECQVYPTDEGGECARFEVSFDCVELGGICDEVTRRCKAPTCEVEGARRCEQGTPQECRRTGDGLLDWVFVGQCEDDQVCQGGECACANPECGEVGEQACAPDGAGVETCAEVDGCLVFETTRCPNPGEVCVESPEGLFECTCAPIDGARAPREGGGCEPGGPQRSCGDDGTPLECGVVAGGCRVWSVDTTCEGSPGVVACQGTSAIVCEQVTSAFGHTCLHPSVEPCPDLEVCMVDATGVAACR